MLLQAPGTPHGCAAAPSDSSLRTHAPFRYVTAPKHGRETKHNGLHLQLYQAVLERLAAGPSPLAKRQLRVLHRQAALHRRVPSCT